LRFFCFYSLFTREVRSRKKRLSPIIVVPGYFDKNRLYLGRVCRYNSSAETRMVKADWETKESRIMVL
jgi:hypothetical protein